jgi:hypothetical protein
MFAKEFPLSNGATLRLATSPVKLNGAELSQVRPDIEVTVTAKDEQAFYADAFFVLPPGNLAGLAQALTNRPASTNLAARRPRLNEAQLVRAHRQGVTPEGDAPFPPATEAQIRSETSSVNDSIPSVNDPVLARALDLLKGLAIVRQPAR